MMTMMASKITFLLALSILFVVGNSAFIRRGEEMDQHERNLLMVNRNPRVFNSGVTSTTASGNNRNGQLSGFFGEFGSGATITSASNSGSNNEMRGGGRGGKSPIAAVPTAPNKSPSYYYYNNGKGGKEKKGKGKSGKSYPSPKPGPMPRPAPMPRPGPSPRPGRQPTSRPTSSATAAPNSILTTAPVNGGGGGGGTGGCGCFVDIVNLEFVMLPFNETVTVAPGVSLETVGSTFVFLDSLFDFNVTVLEGNFVSGYCHRLLPLVRLDGNNTVVGQGYCHFTFTITDGANAVTFNAAGEIFDVLGGTLAITGGTGALQGVFGDIEIVPFYQSDSDADYFLEAQLYVGNATLNVPRVA